MGAYQSTLAGWVVVIGLIAFVVRSNWQKSKTAQPARVEAPRGRQERPVEKPKAKETKKEQKPKEAKEVKKEEPKPKQEKKESKKAKKQAKAAPAPAPAAAAAPAAPKAKASKEPSLDDERASDLEFARQIAMVKQGTKFVGKAKDEHRQKTVKQSRADEERVQSGQSAPSSTDGIDADDDRSSAAASPVLAATEPAEAGNVDDMLEKAAPGPSAIRLVNTEEKAPKKAKAAAFEPVETKKQRQNRQKAELAKAQREEAEKERKVKLEAQRRLAREAEGRAAKDGSAFMAAQAQKSAWTESNGASQTAPAQPLDTFVPSAPKAAPKAAPKPAAFDKQEEWVSSLPSEEEQIQMIREEESWSTVKTKARKSKKQEKENVAVEAAPEAAAAPAKVEAEAPATLAPKARPAVATKSSFDVLKVDNSDDQEETEWDV